MKFNIYNKKSQKIIATTIAILLAVIMLALVVLPHIMK